MDPTEFEHVVQKVRYHTEQLQRYTSQLHSYKPVSLDIKVLGDYKDGQVVNHAEPTTASEKFLASINTVSEQFASSINTVSEQLASSIKTAGEPAASKKRLNVALRNDKLVKKARTHVPSYKPPPYDVRGHESSREVDVFVCKASGNYNWWMNKHGYLTVDGCHFQAHAFSTSILYGAPDIGARVRYDLWKNTKTGKHYAKNICNM